MTCRVARIRWPAASAASRRVKARGTRGARRVLRYSTCGPDFTVTLRYHPLFLLRQIVVSWSPATFTKCLSIGSCMHDTVLLENLSRLLCVMSSRQWPMALPHGFMCQPGARRDVAQMHAHLARRPARPRGILFSSPRPCRKRTVCHPWGERGREKLGMWCSAALTIRSCSWR